MPYITKRRISPPTDKKEDAKRHNDKWNKYYGDKRWKRLRNWQITNFPLCYDCLFNGRSVPATQVHHIKPFSEGTSQEERMNLLLDPNNLVSLCTECHIKRHNILRKKMI